MTNPEVFALRDQAKACNSPKWVALCDAALAGDPAAAGQVGEALEALEWPWVSDRQAGH